MEVKVSGRSRSAAPSRLSSAARPARPTSGLPALVGLEDRRQRSFVERDQGRRVDPVRIAGIGRKTAVHEGMKTRDTQPFGAHVALAGRGFEVRPARPGAGVEQHADERQVDPRARRRGGAAVGEPGVQRVPAIDPAGFEMAPAAVHRDQGEIGETLARQRRNALRHRIEPAALEPEMSRRAGLDRARDVGAARADRRRIAEQGDAAVQFRQGCGPSSPRGWLRSAPHRR